MNFYRAVFPAKKLFRPKTNLTLSIITLTLCACMLMDRVYHQSVQPKFASNNYKEAFQTLFTGMELDGLQCSHEDYGKGYTLVVFDLSSKVADAAKKSCKETRQ